VAPDIPQGHEYAPGKPGEVFIPSLNTGFCSLKRHPPGFRKRTICLCKEYRNHEGVADTGIPTLIPTQEGRSPIQGSNEPYRSTKDCFWMVFGEIDFGTNPNSWPPFFPLFREVLKHSPYHEVDSVNGDCRTAQLINCKNWIFLMICQRNQLRKFHVQQGRACMSNVRYTDTFSGAK
jgi:hypothetical protein